MRQKTAAAELRESIELDQWLADLASIQGNGELVRELEERVREKQAKLSALSSKKTVSDPK
jgi:hypothetical protein